MEPKNTGFQWKPLNFRKREFKVLTPHEPETPKFKVSTLHEPETRKFQWKPLDFRRNEFRILKLQEIIEDNDRKIVSALLQNVPMNGHPPYHALSYTWDTYESNFKMILDGRIHYITENLHEALLVLFSSDVRSLWVDALCINQQDPDEKAAQVLRMATIFQEATIVDIWLGSAHSDSGEALEIIKSGDKSKFENWLLHQRYPNGTIAPLKNCMDLLEREYWNRVWITQEIAVASKIRIFCGSDMVEGFVFEDLFTRALWDRPLQEVNKWFPGDKRAIEHLVNLWDTRLRVKSRQPIDLLNLLFELRTSKATEKLDRVYAILGLSYDQKAFISEPNYTLHPEELCILMTQRFIRTTGSLDIILFNFIPLDRPTLSWICPFLEFRGTRVPVNEKTIIDYVNGRSYQSRSEDLMKIWNATNSSSADDDTLIFEGKSLKVLGLRLANLTDINHYSLIRQNQGHRSNIFKLVDSLSRLIINKDCKAQEIYQLRVKFLKIFRNLTPRDIDDDGNEIYKDIEYQVAKLGWIFSDEFDQITDGAPTDDKGYVDEIESYRYSILEIISDLKFLVKIGSNHLGLVPSLSSLYTTSDEVWLLTGCSIPVILRKDKIDQNGEQSYKFYSHMMLNSIELNEKWCSVMDGEAWRTAKPEDFQWVIIN